MALKVDYVVKETVTNLKRNVTLAFATVVTVALTLTFLGAVLLINRGVDRGNDRFKAGVSLIVFMQPDASTDKVNAVQTDLQNDPQVKTVVYFDHDKAFTEFKQLFPANDTVSQAITDPNELPTSFRVQLKDATSEVVGQIQSDFNAKPGVKTVATPAKSVKDKEEGFRTIRWVAGIMAAMVGSASLVLIINSIRVAMFARRREIEVMKLVGATNTFIRVPFMFEGMLQGIVGAVLGIGAVVAGNAWLLPRLVKTGGIFSDFTLTSGDLRLTSLVMAFAGGVVGVIGSAFAASRFLDV
jgi:cell division transport system permease protein